MAESKLQDTSESLEMYYMEMTAPNVDARLGKLSPGQVIALPLDKARRYLRAGVAKQTNESAFRKQQDDKQERVTKQQEVFQNLNRGGDVWDTATYRDVLTAPESGLRLARERGISLVNVHMLRDENGDVLAPDADIEDILDARELLHSDVQAPFAAHERSSVMGGGSPYAANLGNPMPLNPAHRAALERVAEQEAMAQKPASFSYDRRNPDAKQEQARASERERRAETRARTRNSPQAAQAAADAGVQPPKDDVNESQRGN